MADTSPPQSIPTYHRTQEEFAAAFREWDRQYREEPDTFMSTVEHLLGNTPESYGEAAAAYFVELLGDPA